MINPNQLGRSPFPASASQWMLVGLRNVGPATGYSLSGPSNGITGVASTPFTVTLTPSGGTVTGTVTVTPSDGGGGGTFTPSTVSLTTAAPSTTFTYTPASIGTKTITVTNNGGLTNPGNVSYVVSAASLIDGDPVSLWSDSSGNAHHAAMTGSNRPTFKTAIVNGKPVVRFTTAGASKLDLATTISGAGSWTGLVVLKATGPGVNCISLRGNDAVSNSPFLIQESGDGNTYVSDRTYLYQYIGTFSGAWHVLTCVTGGGTGGILIDGSAIIVTNTLPLGNTGDFARIGWDASGGVAYSDGDIAEIIFYNVAYGLASTDRANVEKYLGTKYGITVAAGTAVDPTTIAGLAGWWKADSLG